MNKFGRPASLLAFGISLCLLAGSQQVTADETVQLSPFGQMVSNLNPANWKMPNFRGMLPQTEEKARVKKKKDSLVDEVGKTASSSWMRTKEVLNPQNLNPSKFFTTSAKSPSTPTPATRKPGFFRSLFGPSAPQGPNTATGFLSQPRPSP